MRILTSDRSDPYGRVTGGDDGKVVWTRRDEEAVVLATAKNQWIDAIDASPASGLIAFSFGRTLSVIDPNEVGFRRDFQHERTVSGVDIGETPDSTRPPDCAGATYNPAPACDGGLR